MMDEGDAKSFLFDLNEPACPESEPEDDAPQGFALDEKHCMAIRTNAEKELNDESMDDVGAEFLTLRHGPSLTLKGSAADRDSDQPLLYDIKNPTDNVAVASRYNLQGPPYVIEEALSVAQRSGSVWEGTLKKQHEYVCTAKMLCFPSPANLARHVDNAWNLPRIINIAACTNAKVVGWYLQQNGWRGPIVTILPMDLAEHAPFQTMVERLAGTSQGNNIYLANVLLTSKVQTSMSSEVPLNAKLFLTYYSELEAVLGGSALDELAVFSTRPEALDTKQLFGLIVPIDDHDADLSGAISLAQPRHEMSLPPPASFLTLRPRAANSTPSPDLLKQSLAPGSGPCSAGESPASSTHPLSGKKDSREKDAGHDINGAMGLGSVANASPEAPLIFLRGGEEARALTGGFQVDGEGNAGIENPEYWSDLATLESGRDILRLKQSSVSQRMDVDLAEQQTRRTIDDNSSGASGGVDVPAEQIPSEGRVMEAKRDAADGEGGEKDSDSRKRKHSRNKMHEESGTTRREEGDNAAERDRAGGEDKKRYKREGDRNKGRESGVERSRSKKERKERDEAGMKREAGVEKRHESGKKRSRRHREEGGGERDCGSGQKRHEKELERKGGRSRSWSWQEREESGRAKEREKEGGRRRGAGERVVGDDAGGSMGVAEELDGVGLSQENVERGEGRRKESDSKSGVRVWDRLGGVNEERKKRALTREPTDVRERTETLLRLSGDGVAPSEERCKEDESWGFGRLRPHGWESYAKETHSGRRGASMNNQLLVHVKGYDKHREMGPKAGEDQLCSIMERMLKERCPPPPDGYPFPNYVKDARMFRDRGYAFVELASAEVLKRILLFVRDAKEEGQEAMALEGLLIRPRYPPQLDSIVNDRPLPDSPAVTPPRGDGSSSSFTLIPTPFRAGARGASPILQNRPWAPIGPGRRGNESRGMKHGEFEESAEPAFDELTAYLSGFSEHPRLGRHAIDHLRPKEIQDVLEDVFRACLGRPLEGSHSWLREVTLKPQLHCAFIHFPSKAALDSCLELSKPNLTSPEHLAFIKALDGLRIRPRRYPRFVPPRLRPHDPTLSSNGDIQASYAIEEDEPGPYRRVYQRTTSRAPLEGNPAYGSEHRRGVDGYQRTYNHPGKHGMVIPKELPADFRPGCMNHARSLVATMLPPGMMACRNSEEQDQRLFKSIDKSLKYHLNFLPDSPHLVLQARCFPGKGHAVIELVTPELVELAVQISRKVGPEAFQGMKIEPLIPVHRHREDHR